MQWKEVQLFFYINTAFTDFTFSKMPFKLIACAIIFLYPIQLLFDLHFFTCFGVDWEGSCLTGGVGSCLIGLAGICLATAGGGVGTVIL